MSSNDPFAAQLTECSKAIARAESRYDGALQVATDDDVERERLDSLRIDEEMTARIMEIGRDLHARGGEARLRDVLSHVERQHRGTVQVAWKELLGIR
jgi:hypothetical protein